MERITTYEEDLQEVTSQLKSLQEKKAQLEQSIIIRDANSRIGEILNKLYVSKFEKRYVFFNGISRSNECFNYLGFRILCDYDFKISAYTEIFESAEDFANKYGHAQEINPVLYQFLSAVKNLTYKANETSAND